MVRKLSLDHLHYRIIIYIYIYLKIPIIIIRKNETHAGELHSQKSHREDFFFAPFMENGERKKISQPLQPYLSPNPPDFQRVVAWSGGSHVPPAIHVSNLNAAAGWWETTLGSKSYFSFLFLFIFFFSISFFLHPVVT